MPKKGKNTFTKSEASEIVKLLEKLQTHPREKQKRVRKYLREKLSFYISDFTSSTSGFNDAAFNHFLKIGDIKII